MQRALALGYLRLRAVAAGGKNTGGLITERLEALRLDEAIPQDWPAKYIEFHTEWCGTEVSKVLARATAWGAALAQVDSQAPMRRAISVITTYGFARVRGRVRLAVIRYLPPFTFPGFEELQPIEIGPHRFPVVLRPWLASTHSGSNGSKSSNGSTSSCWVTFAADTGRRRGLLTAQHALIPSHPAKGDPVTINAYRDDPSGTLHESSSVMDAALVDIAGDDGSAIPREISSVVGYKPVRLLGSMGYVDTDVIEFSGMAAATILGVAKQEPPAPVILFLGRSLRPGDSGCLVLDLEPTMFGREPTPYLIYQGRANLRLASDAGYGLLIEQARRIWNFSVCNKCHLPTSRSGP